MVPTHIIIIFSLPIYNDAIVVAVPRFSGQNLESIHEPSVATSPND